MTADTHPQRIGAVPSVQDELALDQLRGSPLACSVPSNLLHVWVSLGLSTPGPNRRSENDLRPQLKDPRVVGRAQHTTEGSRAAEIPPGYAVHWRIERVECLYANLQAPPFP